MTEVKEKKKLGVLELSGYGIGNCIGSGIFVSMGTGIAFTGRSITLALVVACFVVLFAYAYHTLMAGMFVLPGGKYSQSALLQPPLLVGVSAISTVLTGLSFAMFALSIVEYAATVFPIEKEYHKWIALAIITIFFLTTFLGGKFMAKFNLVMVGVLIISLIIYVIVGLPKVDFSTANPMSEGYFQDGVMGFIMAVACMAFACQGATMPIAMTKDAKEPKKNLPKAIILASVVVAIVYSFIGIVSSGILPIEQVADKNLGVVAEQIFPRPIFIVFVIGGACFAIATSLYGAIASIEHPLMRTVEDGWLPKFLGIKNKKGYPYVMMIILYAIATIPLFTDMGILEMISLMMIPIMVLNIVNNVLMIPLVKKYPNAWKKSFFHMPKWAFYITIALSVVADLLISVALLTTIKKVSEIIAIIVMIVAIFGYSYYRLKAGKVNLHDLEVAKAEAEKLAEAE